MSAQLLNLVQEHFGGKVTADINNNSEVTIIVSLEDYHQVCQTLVSYEGFLFEQLIDLCGVDYQTYPKKHLQNSGRFAVVLHLISYCHNHRIRVKAFLSDENMPVIPTVTDIWAGANWFEREAFDLFGVLFTGHTDLRRILTDYGFVGHPFRKDFPVVGKVETRYDPEQKRVIYQPVSIDERVIVPKVYRN